MLTRLRRWEIKSSCPNAGQLFVLLINCLFFDECWVALEWAQYQRTEGRRLAAAVCVGCEGDCILVAPSALHDGSAVDGTIYNGLGLKICA